jgi:hypothetical protein
LTNQVTLNHSQPLTQEQAEEEENLRCAEGMADISDQFEERPSSTSPVYDDWLEKGGSEAITTVTNFTDTEFHALWAIVDSPLSTTWTTGRGNKCN